MPAFGYDPDATPYEEMSSGRYLPGDIDESPPVVSLIVHDWFECFSFTDDEAGWVKAVRMLRKKSASKNAKDWRIDRTAYWNAGDVGDLVRFYHICYVADLPPLTEAASDATAASLDCEEDDA